MRRHLEWMGIALLLVGVCALQAQTGSLGSGDVAATPLATAPASQKPKLPIKAKTHEEFVAYQAAIVNKQNPEEMAKAAADFAAKFPDSDIRLLLYRASMKSYRTAAESDKMMDAALKVLGLSKDDPEALLAVAQVQEEHTSPMDLDREPRMAQAVANAQHALATIDTDLVVPVGTKAEDVEPYKKSLKASALAIIGSVQYKREQYAEAEATLRQAMEADPGNPDGVVVLRLALALDQEKKYPDALQQANRAIELTKDDTEAGRVARGERDRLTALIAQTSGPGASDVAPPADGATQGN